MINFNIPKKDIDYLFKQINKKIDGIKAVASPTVMTSFAKAAFEITGFAFLKAVDNAAVRNKGRFHHVYEWGTAGDPRGNVGNPAERLFYLKRSGVLYGDLVIESKFKKSVTVQPMPPEFLIPGKTGRIVTRRMPFWNKAEVMEENIPIQMTRAEGFFPFIKNDGGSRRLGFARSVSIMNPGGPKTTHAFRDFMLEWYNSKMPAQVFRQSGFLEEVERRVALELENAGGNKDSVRRVIEGILRDNGMDVKEVW